MSEQRFTIHKESKYKDEWYAYPFCIKCDGELVIGSIPLHIAEAVRDKLNEQQSTISRLEEENEQLSKELKELEKNFEDLVDWSTEISKRNVLLDEKIGRLQQEEKLYAQEILRLNELLKQYQSFKDLGGDY